MRAGANEGRSKAEQENIRAYEQDSMRAESEGRRTGEQDVGEHVSFGRIRG